MKKNKKHESGWYAGKTSRKETHTDKIGIRFTFLSAPPVDNIYSSTIGSIFHIGVPIVEVQQTPTQRFVNHFRLTSLSKQTNWRTQSYKHLKPKFNKVTEKRNYIRHSFLKSWWRSWMNQTDLKQLFFKCESMDMI